MQYIKKFEPLFGNWTAESLIGVGSFGRVYKIRREEFGVTYYSALKLVPLPEQSEEVRQLRAEGMDDKSIATYYEDVVKNIMDEIRLMSRLRGNSYTVSFEDHAVIPRGDGVGYDILIRMELLTGLTQYTLDNRMSRADVIKLGIDILRALELCQRYNIIHRDIKPDNIFISETGNYKLGDFGIARQLEKTLTHMSKKGTYNYMAPEIYKGGRYDSTVDIYSLGIVMYRLLNNNRLPFYPPAPQPIRPDEREQAMVKRMSGQALPPPANADGRLAEIVLKACAYGPRERYSSPAEMRAALEAIAYGEDEAPMIYPDGDELAMHENEYAEITPPAAAIVPPVESVVPVLTEIEDKTESMFDTPEEAALPETPGADKTESLLDGACFSVQEDAQNAVSQPFKPYRNYQTAPVKHQEPLMPRAGETRLLALLAGLVVLLIGFRWILQSYWPLSIAIAIISAALCVLNSRNTMRMPGTQKKRIILYCASSFAIVVWAVLAGLLFGY